MRVAPKHDSDFLCFGFKVFPCAANREVAVQIIDPSKSRANQFLIQTFFVFVYKGKGSPVLINGNSSHLDNLDADHFRGKPLRLPAECLALFRTVNTIQANLYSLCRPAVQYGYGVPSDTPTTVPDQAQDRPANARKSTKRIKARDRVVGFLFGINSPHFLTSCPGQSQGGLYLAPNPIVLRPESSSNSCYCSSTRDIPSGRYFW